MWYFMSTSSHLLSVFTCTHVFSQQNSGFIYRLEIRCSKRSTLVYHATLRPHHEMLGFFSRSVNFSITQDQTWFASKNVQDDSGNTHSIHRKVEDVNFVHLVQVGRFFWQTTLFLLPSSTVHIRSLHILHLGAFAFVFTYRVIHCGQKIRARISSPQYNACTSDVRVWTYQVSRKSSARGAF